MKNSGLSNLGYANIVPTNPLMACREGEEGMTDTMADPANNDKKGLRVKIFKYLVGGKLKKP